MNKLLTVVMLNWMRPKNVARFSEQYAKHPLVAQVIVWDNKGDYDPDARYVTCVKTDEDVGLVSRFAAAALARTEHVLFVDDDIELPDATVQSLLEEHVRGMHGVTGLFGRRPGRDLVYSIADHHGPVEIVLTRACVTSRYFALLAAEYAHQMVAACPDGQPYANGEDIVLSYAAMHMTRQGNWAVKLPFRNHGYDDHNAISVRFKQHEVYRTSVVRWCDALLMPAELRTAPVRVSACG